MQWHPVPVEFVHALSDASAQSPEAIQRALSDIGIYLLTWHRIEQRGPQAAPPCRTLAAQTNAKKDHAQRVRDETIGFFVEWQAARDKKKEGQTPPPPPPPSEMEQVLARLAAAEQAAKDAAARADAAERRASELEATVQRRHQPDTFQTEAANGPTAGRHETDTAPTPRRQEYSDAAGIVEESADKTPTPARHDPDSAPTPRRQGSPGPQSAIRARGITNTNTPHPQRFTPDPSPPPPPLAEPSTGTGGRGTEHPERGEDPPLLPALAAPAGLAGPPEDWPVEAALPPELAEPLAAAGLRTLAAVADHTRGQLASKRLWRRGTVPDHLNALEKALAEQGLRLLTEREVYERVASRQRGAVIPLPTSRGGPTASDDDPFTRWTGKSLGLDEQYEHLSFKDGKHRAGGNNGL